MSEQPQHIWVTIQYRDRQIQLQHDPAQRILVIGRKFLQELFNLNGNCFRNVSRKHLEIGFDPQKEQVWAQDTSLLGTLVRAVNDDSYGPEFLYHRTHFLLKRQMRLRLQNEGVDREPDDVLIDIHNPCYEETVPILAAPPNWERLLSQLRTVRSAHIYGIAGSGKTTLARKLLTPAESAWQRERDRQLGGAALCAWIDCRVWQQDGPLWLQLGRRIVSALVTAADEQYRFDLRDNLRALVQQFDATVQQRVGQMNPIFRQALRLLRDANLRPVLIFDDFDKVFAALDPFMLYQLFQFHQWPEIGELLRFVIVTRRPLEQLRDDLGEQGVSEFYELFARFGIALGCVDQASFPDLWQQISPEGQSVAADDLAAIYALSGGHPGLTRELYHELAVNNLIDNPQQWADNLAQIDWLKRPPQSCVAIWNSLTSAERQVLQTAIEKRPLPVAMRGRLRDHTLLNAEDLPFTPLLATVAQHESAQPPAATIGLQIDSANSRVYVNGQDVTSRLQGRKLDVLLHLYAHRGELCSYADLIRNTVASDAPLNALSIEAERASLQRTVSRLCQIVDSDREIIFNEPGSGYILRNA